jgi:hypothetical protein
VVGRNVGTFLQRARTGRGCLARASAGDRAVAAQGGLASLRVALFAAKGKFGQAYVSDIPRLSPGRRPQRLRSPQNQTGRRGKRPLSRSIFCRWREDRSKLTLEARRAQLESLVSGIDAITFNEAVDAEGAIVFAKACEMGRGHRLEATSRRVYPSGPCRNWLKVRNPDFQRR